jgi:hypothetical protein
MKMRAIPCLDPPAGKPGDTIVSGGKRESVEVKAPVGPPARSTSTDVPPGKARA